MTSSASFSTASFCTQNSGIGLKAGSKDGTGGTCGWETQPLLWYRDWRHLANKCHNIQWRITLTKQSVINISFLSSISYNYDHDLTTSNVLRNEYYHSVICDSHFLEWHISTLSLGWSHVKVKHHPVLTTEHYTLVSPEEMPKVVNFPSGIPLNHFRFSNHNSEKYHAKFDYINVKLLSFVISISYSFCWKSDVKSMCG